VTRFITLAEFWWLAEQVTGINAEVVGKSGSYTLADSALHASKPASVVKTSTLT
jgi:death on curing protein